MKTKHFIREIELSAIRHDLRTPVNHIIGYSELLLEEAGEGLGEDLQRIHSGGRELLSVINEFFDDATFDLNKVREDATLLKLRTPVTQIIGYCELLFEEASDRATKEILDDLNRVLTAASEWLNMMESTLFPMAKGELSIVTKHKKPKPGPLTATPFPKQAELTGRLLLIMDPGEFTDELRDLTQSGGHQLDSVPSIEEALERMKHGPVDLILLAASPHTEGAQQLVDSLAANTKWRSVPVIIVAPLEQIDLATRSIKAGADGFLSIPFHREQTLRLINRQLTEKRLRDRTAALTGRILVVDDDENNRDVLSKRLKRSGHEVTTTTSAETAISLLLEREFDLLLLDMIMAGMNGDEALAQIKSDKRLQNLPVIMISGLDQMDDIVRCIEMGAEDYLPKPFDATLLKARIHAALEKKRLRDQEAIHLEEIEIEKARSENLLLNILPVPIANRLKEGEQVIADHFPSVSVLFSDLVGFTQFSTQIPPQELVILLNRIFTEFDEAAATLGIEKIKTIGDAYMAAAGLPRPSDHHARSAVLLGKAMLRCLATLRDETGLNLAIRVGIHSGPATAGIIGKNKFIYDLWGDTVNVASRMESHGEPGWIQITDTTAALLGQAFQLKERGPLPVKGKGMIKTFLIDES